jgi:acetate---CoA ligase (ADP-forming)
MSLESFFKPKSVAIIGASRQPGKVGYEIVKSMKEDGFPGKVYPINPKADEVAGLKCYPDLKSTGDSPELTVIIVPAKYVHDSLKECIAVGCKTVIIISAGFKETGAEGKKLELEIAKTAKENGVRIVGPNCLGVLSCTNKMNASFGGKLPKPGAIGYFSQSGALLVAILDMSNANDIGYSEMVSFGNKCDVNEMDVVDALGEDKDTKVIAGYLESVVDGQGFIAHAAKIARKKPVLLMKSGGTGAGAAAASSHTGSLAGSETAYKCAFERAGIIRCPSIKQQFDYAQAFANQPLPAGKRVAVITNAGGPGIMAADAIERQGLPFAKLTDETMKKLAANLPAAANVKNPVDVLGDALADRYEMALDVVLADPGVDICVVVLTPQVMTDCPGTATAIVNAAKKYPTKPMFTCFLGGEMITESLRIFRKNGIPQFDSPEAAAETIRVMCDYADWKARPERKVETFKVDKSVARRIIDAHLSKGMREIGELDAKEILASYGFAIPKGGIAKTADEAAKLATSYGYPVVMKINSPDISHKSDVGGVKVNLKNADEVKAAFAAMMKDIPAKSPKAKLEGVSIQQMADKPGAEIILGVKRDPSFGPMVMFGLGGIFVEVLKDVAFTLAPMTRDEAMAVMQATKSYKLLQGVRGQQGVDIDGLAECLQRLGQLVSDFPEIVELDINPCFAYAKGKQHMAVDGRMSVEKA